MNRADHGPFFDESDFLGESQEGIKRILPMLHTSKEMKYAQWIMKTYSTVESLRPLGRKILSEMMYGFLGLVQTRIAAMIEAIY